MNYIEVNKKFYVVAKIKGRVGFIKNERLFKTTGLPICLEEQPVDTSKWLPSKIGLCLND